MSASQGGMGGGGGGREFGPGDWASAAFRRGECGASRWTPFEIAAMVLGFMVYWPIGLAVLGYKIYQRKTGASDLQTVAAGKWREARRAMGPWVSETAAARPWVSGQWAGGVWGGRRAYSPASGNSAFDAWKAGELARLEEERRKLEQSHREFSEFLDQVRQAKDREEFERFMSDRKARANGEHGPAA